MISCFSLAGKNRDLNQTFEKIQQMDIAKQKLMDELSALRATLEEKDKDIEKYSKKNLLWIENDFLNLFSLKEDCDRIRYNCDQEVFNTRLKVKDIIVSKRILARWKFKYTCILG